MGRAPWEHGIIKSALGYWVSMRPGLFNPDFALSEDAQWVSVASLSSQP